MVVTQNILGDFLNKRDKIFRLSSLCGNHENNIAKKLFEILGWNNLSQKKYNGLFGWKEFRTDKCRDKCRELNERLLIIEVKKVTEKSEYGYWHALIQGTIYSLLQRKEEDKSYSCFALF